MQSFLFITFSFFFLLTATVVPAAQVTLKAVDTASVETTNGNDLWNDNRLRAYNVATRIDGFIKFDLSSLPANATIQAMTLTAYAEGNPSFGAPFGNPTIQIYRSNVDNWARGGTGFPTSYNEALTAADAGPFPTTSGTPYRWNLNVGAVDWSTDLTDKLLTLVMVDEVPNSYMYWFGSGGSTDPTGTYAPTLTMTIKDPAAPIAVPTITEWGMLILAILLGVGSLYYLRKQMVAV